MSRAARRARAIPTEQKDALFGSIWRRLPLRFLIGRPAVAEQAGSAYHRRATRYRPGRNAHPEIRSGAGRRHPTHPPVRGRDRLSGSLLFPEQHPADFVALRAEAAMRFALRGQSAGRRVRLSGQTPSAAGAPQPIAQHRSLPRPAFAREAVGFRRYDCWQNRYASAPGWATTRPLFGPVTASGASREPSRTARVICLN